MQLLKERILKDAKTFPGNILKVDSFLNHQIDVDFLCEIGKEFKKRFSGCTVTKILTIESSGIGIACVAAQFFKCPVLFAKKTKTKNISSDVYQTKVASYTHGTSYDVVVSKEFLTVGDSVLIIDDFLANGQALLGLIDLANQAGATVAGCGIVIEKSFQTGAELIKKTGIKLESLAKIKSLDDGVIFV
ncbi:MAG: xanthine phosphoribosyltransferase [Oscillospiraceae bacterium]|nr:xanthine phosphoribosyltransferase [Oscillospiraceae bacterium]